MTWSVEPADDGDKFDINSTTGALTFKNAPNFETPNDVGDTAGNNTYVVTVKVEDNGVTGDTSPMSDTHTITVTVADVNEAPTITTAATTASVAENSTAVLTLAATDVDASTTLLWSVESDDDGDLFQINSSGVLSFINAPNFEDKQDAGGNNVYDVTVKVTDAGNLFDTLAVNVTVTNVNEAPEITTVSTTYTAFTVDENTETSVVIKTYMATDVDADTTLTWSLEGNDAGDFTITTNAQGHGDLKFASVPNFEIPDDTGTMNDYDIRVKVKDDGIPSDRGASNQLDNTVSVTVDVDDINEVPVITTSATTDSVPENSIAVLTFAATDMDEGFNLTWSVESANDGGIFDINPSTGALTFKNAPDFETPTDTGDTAGNNTYVVTVRVSDGVLSVTHTITVTVTD